MKTGVAHKKRVGISVFKTTQNPEQLRLVKSIHNENNKNDNEVFGIIMS